MTVPKKKQSSQRKSQGTTERERKSSWERTVQNREFAVITYLFLGLFLLMMGYLVYFQVLRSEDFINSPYNKRQDTFGEHVVRGEILSADGVTLAQTVVGEDGSETRYYPYGAMFAHAVGYDVNGKAGIESFANFNLLRSHAFFLEQILNGIQEKKNPGDNVVTTLNYKLQETAYQALGDSYGAVIATEPSTGKILAMVSKPDFNPNAIAQEWEAIVSDENNSVLLNRVTQGLYPPGSTFKIFTALEYMQENPDYDSYSYECTGSLAGEEADIHCAGNSVHGQEDLKSSFANSCNTSFANIGLGLDRDRFAGLCHSLLFDTDLPIAYPSTQSRFVLNGSSTEFQTMQTSIGQGETLMTPLHMALVTGAIANNGTLMRPYVIDHTENYKGVTVKQYRPSSYGVLLSSQESSKMQELMRSVVTDGTGHGVYPGNFQAYGKTGTAEYSNNKGEAHAWFTGYAINEEQGKTIQVTVVVEGGNSGGRTAVPIAKAIFDAYFN